MLKVVDENVIVVANDLTQLSLGAAMRCPEASEDCRLACAEALEQIIEDGSAVLDQESEFLDKYKAHASFAGQPGIGDAFLRFVYERGYDTDWVTRVEIREDGHYRLPIAFSECGFDADDLLWVAAAYNAPGDCAILNAADSDYALHEADLDAIGVNVLELCDPAP